MTYAITRSPPDRMRGAEKMSAQVPHQTTAISHHGKTAQGRHALLLCRASCVSREEKKKRERRRRHDMHGPDRGRIATAVDAGGRVLALPERA